MNATVNAFPPLHSLNSSRGWFIALIVLLHAGFFWALTAGHTVYIWKPPPQGPITPIPIRPVVPPKPVVQPQPPTGVTSHVVDPIPLPPDVDYRDTVVDTAPQVPARPEIIEGPGSAVPMPLIVEPALDPRYPFTEPEYPVSEIRQGHEGTVLLSLEILPNGRVGDVRIEQSSGFQKLDDSAAREAKRWRMRPGTSDGTAKTMWKKVPIRFQLKN